MVMRIVFNECKKALTSPIILVLLVLFTAYNIFLIHNVSDNKEQLHVVNELAEKYGVKITDESLSKLEGDLKKDLSAFNEITEKETSKTYANPTEFFDQLRYEQEVLFTKKDLNFLHKIYLKKIYFESAKTIVESYKKIDIKHLGESSIRSFELSGTAAETFRKQFEKFADRFDELQGNGEHTQWFFAGKQYFMHSLLFKFVFKHIIFESIILIVLATALITNYEIENKAHLVAFTAKRGRCLMIDKLLASLLVTLAITMFLLVTTLGTYFTSFDYTHLLNSSISSFFNWEYQFPYISWWDMSFLTFTILCIVLMTVCMLLFSALTFSISILFKNSYFTVLIFWIQFFILFMLQGFVPSSSNLIFYAGFNLSSLIFNPHVWFMGNKGLIMYKHYELITVLIWTFIIVMLCVFSIKRFKKQEII
jgi:hypothetical protein